MRLKILSLLFLIQILIVSQAKLTVYRIENETTSVKVGSVVRYSVGNFGKIPYGKRLIGQLYTITPATGCEPFKFNLGLNQSED